MKKFQLKKTKRQYSLLYALITFILAILVFMPALNSISQNTHIQQKKSLEEAIHRSIIECYALEGSYPQSLQYLEEHYGITYDKNNFFVDYQAIAENIIPSVTVIER